MALVDWTLRDARTALLARLMEVAVDQCPLFIGTSPHHIFTFVITPLLLRLFLHSSMA